MILKSYLFTLRIGKPEPHIGLFSVFLLCIYHKYYIKAMLHRVGNQASTKCTDRVAAGDEDYSSDYSEE
jgi:hypothetical protein